MQLLINCVVVKNYATEFRMRQSVLSLTSPNAKAPFILFASVFVIRARNNASDISLFSDFSSMTITVHYLPHAVVWAPTYERRQTVVIVNTGATCSKSLDAGAFHEVLLSLPVVGDVVHRTVAGPSRTAVGVRNASSVFKRWIFLRYN